MHWNRRRFLLSTAGAGMGLLFGRLARASIPSQLEHHRIKTQHSDLIGMRIAHLTDVHVHDNASQQRLAQAVRICNREQPHLVLLTGDYVTWGQNHIESMADTFAALRTKTVAVLGNHDHYAGAEQVSAALQQRHISLIDNRSMLVEHGKARIRLIGIGDTHTKHDDVDAALSQLDEGDDFRIVLAHNPNTADKLPADSADLILCGHTHGGQIDIRGLTSWVVRSVGSSYVRGFYQHPAGLLYVNRGWGTVGVPVRKGAPAELAIFHLCA